jgi:hypothetical protein
MGHGDGDLDHSDIRIRLAGEGTESRSEAARAEAVTRQLKMAEEHEGCAVCTPEFLGAHLRLTFEYRARAG